MCEQVNNYEDQQLRKIWQQYISIKRNGHTIEKILLSIGDYNCFRNAMRDLSPVYVNWENEMSIFGQRVEIDRKLEDGFPKVIRN